MWALLYMFYTCKHCAFLPFGMCKLRAVQSSIKMGLWESDSKHGLGFRHIGRFTCFVCDLVNTIKLIRSVVVESWPDGIKWSSAMSWLDEWSDTRLWTDKSVHMARLDQLPRAWEPVKKQKFHLDEPAQMSLEEGTVGETREISNGWNCMKRQ